MKILAAADIHGAQYRLNLILKNIQVHTPDLVIIPGDITQFGPAEQAIQLLNQIPLPTFAITGNIDTPEIEDAITKSNAKNINGTRIIFQEIPFIGLAGPLTSPLASVMIYDPKLGTISLDEIVDSKTVLVTHIPPYKTQDRVFLGHHIGSKVLRSFVETAQPRLIISGHVHENPGVTVLGSTQVLNCSIGKRTEGAIIYLNSDTSIKILD